MISLEIGDTLIGVVTNRRDVGAFLRRALVDYASEREAKLNLTVVLSDDPTELHRLLWGGCAALRTLDPDRLWVALWRHLSGHGPTPPTRLRTSAPFVVREDRAWILPSSIRPQLSRYVRALERHGFVGYDGPWTELDPATRSVVVPDLPAPPALSGLGALASPRRRPEPALPPGTYDVAGITLPGAPEDDVSSAEAMMAILADRPSHAMLNGALIEDLNALVTRSARWHISDESPQNIIRELRRRA